ncbi:MAG: hypothetical protein Q9161_002063 [Pseudevernia consocians]
MDTSNPSITMQQHFSTMPSSDSSITCTALVSDRIGIDNMDGQGILSGQSKAHARPWPGCIPLEQLSKDNLPPFYVRLQDDQVGHLAYWVGTSRGSITRLKLGQVWPWDFDVQGKVSSRRDSWGAEYRGCGKERGKGLGGGKKVPTWADPGLPLTYTSSHKVMAWELDALKKGAASKRKAEEEAGKTACMPVKKPRLSNMGTELKRIKENIKNKRQKDKATDKEKERYAGAKTEIRDALQVVDTLLRSAGETENQNATLEAMLLNNEAQYIKDTDDMFDEWLAYNDVKRKEVNRIHDDHAVEIKSRDAKIEALETETKGSRARLDREKHKVRVRDERLARVKSRWVQQQDQIDRKLRQIECLAVDLDELSELNYETDESEDETSDFEAEAEKADEETKEEPKQEVKEVKEPETTRPANREPREASARDGVKRIDAQDIVNLDEDDYEEEDDGLFSSSPKVTLRNLVQNRPVKSV